MPIILQDNAPIHLTENIVNIFNKHKFEVLPHAPYSPDVAPSDYHLFKNMKSFLRGQKFITETELTSAVDAYFSSKSADFYKNGINNLRTRLQQVIDCQGEYIHE